MKKFRKRDGIWQLVKAGNRVNRNRNKILTLAMALVIIVLFSAFNLAKGKIVIDSIKNLRENGTASSAYLENGEESQYEKLKNLDYIDYVGQEHMVGSWNQKDTLLATCQVIDKTGYEKIIKPAYDEISGHYPMAENEIMLSKKLLKRLGILQPQLGMKIAVPILFHSWTVNDGNELTEEFQLSGYYNDYMEESEHIPAAYLSNKYLELKNIPPYPVKLLIVYKHGFLSASQIEKQLYQDAAVINEKQQFIANDSDSLQAVNKFIGGYGIAVLCTIVVLISAYLFIYNVLSISLDKDVRNYGLLFTIGLTQKQVRKLIFRQDLVILIKGIGGGIIFSLLIGSIGFPILFEGLFLQQKGKISAATILYPEILIGAVLIVTMIMLLASGQTVRKLKKLGPMEAFRYTAVTASRHQKLKSKKGASLGRMAWYNIFDSKRKFFRGFVYSCG